MGDGALGRTGRLTLVLGVMVISAWLAPAASATQCAPGYSNPIVSDAPDQSVCQLTLNATGAPQTVAIPSGVDSITIRAVGGIGGISQTTTPGNDCGRIGSEYNVGLVAQGGLAVAPGEQLTAVVGGNGQPGTEDTGGAGGYGGGGTGAPNTMDYANAGNGCGAGGSGGGGGSFVYGSDGTLLIAAGGGGGGSFPNYTSSVENGGNATVTGGGAAATGPGATGAGKGGGPAGKLGTFGEGGGGGAGCFFGGGGGGGGYYGGGGSGGGGDSTGHACSAGNPVGGGLAGSGSSFFSPVLTAPQTIATGFSNNGPIYLHGYVFISYSSLVVNSTALTPDNPTSLNNGLCNTTPAAATATCTLPAAIAVANKQAGETIDFDIPSEVDGVKNTFDASAPRVPQIQDPAGNAIPSITAPLAIDGATQPGGKVELSGHNNTPAPTIPPTPVTHGLQVAAGGAGSSIAGMVINGYGDQIDLQGGGTTVRGNWLNTTTAGTVVDANPLNNNDNPQRGAMSGVHLESSGNRITGNVIALTYYDPALTQTRAAAGVYGAAGLSGNVIDGNTIGIIPGTDRLLSAPYNPAAAGYTGVEPSVWVQGTDTVGGTDPGAANTVSSALIAGNSKFEGNTVHGTVTALGDATIGGATSTPGTAPGNEFAGTTASDGADVNLQVQSDGVRVEGNKFAGAGYSGIVLTASHTTIGGTAKEDGNLIEGDAAALIPIGAGGDSGPTGDLIGPGAGDAGIAITGDDNLVENNLFENNGNSANLSEGWTQGAGVQVVGGAGNTITGNAMTGNALGIELGTAGYLVDVLSPFNPSGPNDLEPYPTLDSSSTSAAGTTVTGKLDLSGTVTVDLYAASTCAPIGAVQGERLIGSRTVHSLLGDFTATIPGHVPAGTSALTATTTGKNGSTSEFSPCVPPNGKALFFPSAPVQLSPTTVPVTESPGSAGDVARPARAAGRTGRATVFLVCPPRTAKLCAGRVTIATTGRRPLTIVASAFKTKPGLAARVRLTVPVTLFAELEHKHRLRVTARVAAHDGARHPHHRTTRARLTLVYAVRS